MIRLLVWSRRIHNQSASSEFQDRRQNSDLSAILGCSRDEKGGIVIDPVTEESGVRGVFAGDASRDVLLVAAAIG
jgi:hypothetical protein